jgi:hypothetical protein
VLFVPYFFIRALLKSVAIRKNIFQAYKKERGMSLPHDWFDWLGGFPFEVASVEKITEFYKAKGFSLRKVVTTNGWGNNQFVFVKDGQI